VDGERGLQKASTGLNPNERLNQSFVQTADVCRGERLCRLAKKKVDPLVNHLKTNTACAGGTGIEDDRYREPVFPWVGPVNCVDQDI